MAEVLRELPAKANRYRNVTHVCIHLAQISPSVTEARGGVPGGKEGLGGGFETEWRTEPRPLVEPRFKLHLVSSLLRFKERRKLATAS